MNSSRQPFLESQSSSQRTPLGLHVAIWFLVLCLCYSVFSVMSAAFQGDLGHLLKNLIGCLSGGVMLYGLLLRKGWGRILVQSVLLAWCLMFFPVLARNGFSQPWKTVAAVPEPLFRLLFLLFCLLLIWYLGKKPVKQLFG
jgi:hypothetical protein